MSDRVDDLRVEAMLTVERFHQRYELFTGRKLSPNTLQHALQQGHIRHVEIAGNVLIHPSEVENWSPHARRQ